MAGFITLYPRNQDVCSAFLSFPDVHKKNFQIAGKLPPISANDVLRPVPCVLFLPYRIYSNSIRVTDYGFIRTVYLSDTASPCENSEIQVLWYTYNQGCPNDSGQGATGAKRTDYH